MQEIPLAPVLDQMADYDDCLASLSRVSALGNGVGAMKSSCGVDLTSADVSSSQAIAQAERSLEKAGTASLLRSFPVGDLALAAFAPLMAVAAGLVAARRLLRVDLTRANSHLALEQRLAQARLPRGPIAPAFSAAGGARLTQLASAQSMARRNFRFGVLQPDAGRRLEAMLGRFRANGLLGCLRHPPFGLSMLNGLRGLAGFAGGMQLLGRGFGINPLQMTRGQVQALRTTLASGSPLSVTCAQAAAGRFGAAGAIRIPTTDVLAQQAMQVQTVQAVRRSLGIDLRSPTAGNDLYHTLRALERGGACKAAKAAPIGDPELAGLASFQTFAAGVGAPKGAFGADITQPGASAQLAKAANGFARSGGANAVQDLTMEPHIMDGLSKLTLLGVWLGGL